MLNPTDWLTFSNTYCNVHNRSSSSTFHSKILPSFVFLNNGFSTYLQQQQQHISISSWIWNHLHHRMKGEEYVTFVEPFWGPYERNSSKVRSVTLFSINLPWKIIAKSISRVRTWSYSSVVIMCFIVTNLLLCKNEDIVENYWIAIACYLQKDFDTKFHLWYFLLAIYILQANLPRSMEGGGGGGELKRQTNNQCLNWIQIFID